MAGAHVYLFSRTKLNSLKCCPGGNLTQDTVNIHAYNLAVNTYNGTAILNICYGTNGNEVLSEGASSLLEPSEWMKIHYKGPKS